MRILFITLLLLFSTSTCSAESWQLCAQSDNLIIKADLDSIAIKNKVIGMNVLLINVYENRKEQIKYARANFYVNIQNKQYITGKEFHFDATGKYLDAAPPMEQWETASSDVGRETVQCLTNFYKINNNTI